jgi:predicted site-specific integrase-resolvase
MTGDKIEKIRKDVQELYKENSEQIIAAIYARVSSPKQMNNYSLDEQVRICRERCELMGWKVRYIFRDVMTAESTDRPMFRKMMEKARQRKLSRQGLPAAHLTTSILNPFSVIA